MLGITSTLNYSIDYQTAIVWNMGPACHASPTGEQIRVNSQSRIPLYMVTHIMYLISDCGDIAFYSGAIIGARAASAYEKLHHFECLVTFSRLHLTGYFS